MNDDEQESHSTEQRMTNVEFVTELMQFSRCGALSLALPLIDVVHNHSITRSSLPGPRASFLRTSLG